MALLEVEGGAETEGTVTTGALVDAMALQLKHERVALLRSLDRERQEGGEAASFVNERWVLDLDLLKTTLQVVTDLILAMREILRLDDSVLGSGQLRAHRVTEEGVEVTVTLIRSSLVSVVEAA